MSRCGSGRRSARHFGARGPSAAIIHQARRFPEADTGNLRVVQLLLGHAKVDSTVRSPGIDLEDALAIAESTEVEGSREPPSVCVSGRSVEA